MTVGVSYLMDAIAARGNLDAVVAGDARIRYEEVHRFVVQLAREFARLGVPGKAIIGVTSLDSVIWPVVALGVISAGRVFLPVPSSNGERVHSLRPQWIIGASDDIDSLRDKGSAWPAREQITFEGKSICETQFLQKTEYCTINDGLVNPDIGYLVSSSGSTAAPKAIMGSLLGLRHFVEWQIATFPMQPQWRFSQITPPIFDPVYREIFTAWLSGGVVVLPSDRQDILVPQRLVEFLGSERINVLHAVPTLLRLIENGSSETILADLRYIFSAGEQLFGKDVSALRRAAPNATIVNLYGPSETTLAKFSYVAKGLIAPDERVPVGLPIPGANAILLSPENTVCATGEVGEIVIRTKFRSHGYLNDDEMTRRNFVTNPFSQSPTDLLFKTGDLGRTLHSGDVIIVGRNDDRLKIRGMWVELALVEGSLRDILGCDVCVVATNPNGGERELICYVVGAYRPIAQLRRAAAKRLPYHAIPSRWLFISALPKTETGKIDRRALLAATAETEAHGDSGVPPRSNTEAQLLAIFREAIEGVGDIDVGSDFFSIGGQSIEAARIAGRIEERFGVRIPIHVVYDAGNVETLAGHLAAHLLAFRHGDHAEFAVHISTCGSAIDLRGTVGRLLSAGPEMIDSIVMRLAPSRSQAPVRNREATESVFPLSGAQFRFSALERARPHNRSLTQAYAVRIRGQLETNLLRKALDQLLLRHRILRVAIDLERGTQATVLVQSFPFMLHDCSRLSDQQVLDYILDRTLLPFDLSSPPLMRAELYAISPTEAIFVLSSHVIISDGRSKEIWLSELGELYGALSNGLARMTAGSESDFLDFAALQANRRQCPNVADVEYWRAQSKHFRLRPRLPYDHPVVNGSVNEAGDTLSVVVAKSITGRLRNTAARLRKTQNVLLLSAVLLALRDWSGEQNITLKMPHENRPVEYQNAAGCFTDSLLLSFEVGGADVGTLIRVADATLNEALGHAGLSFEMIADLMGLGADRYDPAVIPIMFAPQPVFSRAFELPGLECIPFAVTLPTSIFHLHIFSHAFGDELRLDLNFSTAVFDRASIEKFANRLIAAVGAVAQA
jgi:acyl-coenzyme A synthetase/AMP-(fatty) acid ligase/acyl carrier protein